MIWSLELYMVLVFSTSAKHERCERYARRGERSHCKRAHVRPTHGACSSRRQNRDATNEGIVGMRAVQFNTAELSEG